LTNALRSRSSGLAYGFAVAQKDETTASSHGMDNISFNALFTRDGDVIFAFRGYRWLIHSMVDGRVNEARFHVRGFNDEGTTTTSFDMVVLNKMSRFYLPIDALRHVPRLRSQASDAIDMFEAKLYEHHVYIRQSFQDMPEIQNWRWTKDFSEANSGERTTSRPAIFGLLIVDTGRTLYSCLRAESSDFRWASCANW